MATLPGKPGFSFFVAPSPTSPQILTSSPLPAATQSSAYSTTFTAGQGTPPYTWALLSASGSNSWAIGSSSGILTGTPGTAETDLLVVQVTDATGWNVSGPFSLTVNSIAQGDWPLRSTAAGVVFFTPLSTQAQLNTYHFVGTETTPPSLDSSVTPFGQPASIKFTVDPNDTTQSGTLKIPFGTTFAPGSTVWVSFRERMPPEFAYMVAPTSDGSVQGFKQCIISGVTNSHTNFEVVWENNLNVGAVLGYNANNGGQGSGGFNNWEVSYNPATGQDFKYQPAIGNDGGGAWVSPDSVYSNISVGGTDPDGGTFTANQKEWSRIGGSFDSQSNGAFAYGLGHPLAGTFRFPINQWATYTYRTDVGTFDTAASRIRAWVAPEGQPYTKLVDNSGVILGSDTDAGFNCAWPMPYYTNRLAGGRSVASRTNNITGVTIRTVGLGTTAGAGSLVWNAAAKTLTWAESGGAAGTARGVASWKRFVNVITSGGTGNNYGGGKYLGLEITNFAGLPGTNQTDTVTIQASRLATQTNKGELIVSSQPINATAYNSAGVQIGPTGGYAPVDNPGGVIGAAALLLSQGQATSVTIPQTWNLNAFGDSIFEYCQKVFYDNTNDRLRFFGISHQTGTSGYREYQLSTDSITSSTTIPGVGGQPEHTYAGCDCDDNGNAYFARGQGSTQIIVRNSAGTYTTFTNPLNPQSDFQNAAFHRTRNELLVGFAAGFIKMTPSGTITILRNTPANNDLNTTSGEGGCSTYSYKDSSVYIGGNNTLWRYDASGTLTRLTVTGAINYMGPAAIDGGNNNNVVLVGCGGRMLAISPNAKTWWEFDEIGLTWTNITASIPVGLVNFFTTVSNSVLAVAGYIAAYGVIVFMIQNNATVNPTVWILKRSQ